ncbi:hypothetical protein [Salinisphaera hydrothermalis]|uniref:hypothetical protein n=1 Tax=Salinisphaera hydrothermalis TaxID=563188 RepID=UPI00333FE7E8
MHPIISAAIAGWANRALVAETEAVSDGLPAFRALRAEVASHLAIVTGSGRASATHPEFPRAPIPIHALKFVKYAARYLVDVQHRFNRRYDLRCTCRGSSAPHTPRHLGPKIGSGWLRFGSNQVFA